MLATNECVYVDELLLIMLLMIILMVMVIMETVQAGYLL